MNLKSFIRNTVATAFLSLAPAFILAQPFSLGGVNVKEGDSEVQSGARTLDFDGDDFNTSVSGNREVNIVFSTNTNKFILNIETLQSGATFYVSSGTITEQFNIKTPSVNQAEFSFNAASTWPTIEIASDDPVGSQEGGLVYQISDVNTFSLKANVADGFTVGLSSSSGTLGTVTRYTIDRTDGSHTLSDQSGTTIAKFGTVLDCSGNSNGGALTADASGNITCSDDDSSAGGGDNLGSHIATETLKMAGFEITQVSTISAQTGRNDVHISTLTSIIGPGTGIFEEYDLKVGDTTTPDYGGIQLGNSGIYRTNQTIGGSLDLGGAVVLRNEGNLDAGNDPGIEFLIIEQGNTGRFAIPEAGAGNATAMIRSVTVAGPWSANNNVVQCATWGFDDLDCDTSGTGADLGVQDDLQVGGTIYVSTITAETGDADFRITTNTVITGNLNPSGGVTNGSLEVADLSDLTLNDPGNPDGNATFDMGTFDFQLNLTGNGSAVVFDRSNTTGDLLSLTQNSGNTAAGDDMLHIETNDQEALGILNLYDGAEAIKTMTRWQMDSATPADGDYMLWSIRFDDSGGTADEYARMVWSQLDTTDTTEDAAASIELMNAGSRDQLFWLSGSSATLGNYNFNTDQTVGAGQDNYVLTYDNGTGEIGLEVAGAGSGDVVLAATQTFTGGNTFVSSTTFISSITVKGPYIDGSGSAGTSGQVLTSNGNGNDPTWQAAAGGGATVMDVIHLVPAEANIPASNPGDVDLGDDQHKILYDASTDESNTWTNLRIHNWNGGTLKSSTTFTMVSASSNSVVFNYSLWCITPGDSEDMDADGGSFDTINISTVTVPATIGYSKQFSLTLSNKDSLAEGDICAFKVARDADAGDDNAIGDMELRHILLYEEN